MNELAQFGTPAIMAFLIIREVFTFIKVKRNGNGDENEKRDKRIDQLWDVHLGPTAMDKNNEPKWYATTEINTERHNQVLSSLNRLISVSEEIRDAIKANGRH